MQQVTGITTIQVEMQNKKTIVMIIIIITKLILLPQQEDKQLRMGNESEFSTIDFAGWLKYIFCRE